MMPRPRVSATPAQVAELRSQRLSWREIGKMLGIGASTAFLLHRVFLNANAERLAGSPPSIPENTGKLNPGASPGSAPNPAAELLRSILTRKPDPPWEVEKRLRAGEAVILRKRFGDLKVIGCTEEAVDAVVWFISELQAESGGGSSL